MIRYVLAFAFLLLAPSAYAAEADMYCQSTIGNNTVFVPCGNFLTFSAIVPNNTTSVAVKASGGSLYSIIVSNSGATAAYLKLYNSTQPNTTCGTNTPVARILIPGVAAGGWTTSVTWNFGMAFTTGITYCVTTGIADNDTTAPAATTFIVNANYL